MVLTRYCYADEYTLGVLTHNGETLHTIERPWLPGLPGGLPFVSCVPDGRYQLLEHVRAGGDRVPAMRNPDLGVYYSERSVPSEGGRYLCLLHSANWVRQVQGCIAPGISAGIAEDVHRTYSSRVAMRSIMRWFNGGDDVLHIRRHEGAV